MKLPKALLATSMLAATAVIAADDAHDHAKPPAAADRGMGGMHAMQEHMKAMREQMAQIRAAKDPKERERLMDEHMKTMEQSMSKMQGMMGCGKS